MRANSAQVNRFVDKILKEDLVNKTALRVFVSWVFDKPNYTVTTTQLATRLSVPRQSVRKGFIQLLELGMLKEATSYSNGEDKRATRSYILDFRYLKAPAQENFGRKKRSTADELAEKEK